MTWFFTLKNVLRVDALVWLRLSVLSTVEKEVVGSGHERRGHGSLPYLPCRGSGQWLISAPELRGVSLSPEFGGGPCVQYAIAFFGLL